MGGDGICAYPGWKPGLKCDLREVDDVFACHYLLSWPFKNKFKFAGNTWKDCYEFPTIGSHHIEHLLDWV